MNDKKMLEDVFLVGEEELELRLDKLLSQRFPHYSRTYFQELIRQGYVLVNGSPCKKRETLQAGDEVDICFQLPPEIDVEPENIPLEILFEDGDLLVINKPAGLVVHPAPGHFRHTFVHALLYHCKQLEKEGQDPTRPGIVHRLDKDTSGALIAAKTSFAHQKLVELFLQRKINKTYLALCLHIPSQTVITAPIKRHPTKRQEMAVVEGGKDAITHLQILAHNKEFSLLHVDLITGRTHQIRVHLKHIGCPILGDPVYGSDSTNQRLGITRQLLHARHLSFPHPRTGEEISILAPIPSDMGAWISALSHLPNLKI